MISSSKSRAVPIYVFVYSQMFMEFTIIGYFKPNVGHLMCLSRLLILIIGNFYNLIYLRNLNKVSDFCWETLRGQCFCH